jgi:hypothetical protein
MTVTNRDTRRRSLLLIGFAVFFFFAANYWPTLGPRVSAQLDDSTFKEELEKGKDLLQRRKYDEALKSFKRANEMQQKKCAECFRLMAEAYFG